MTEPSEKSLLLAHDVMWPGLADYSREFKLRHAAELPLASNLARYLDERDKADAQREAEVERVVDDLEPRLAASQHAPDGYIRTTLRSLKRAKPEPDPQLVAMRRILSDALKRGGDLADGLHEARALHGYKLVKEEGDTA